MHSSALQARLWKCCLQSRKHNIRLNVLLRLLFYALLGHERLLQGKNGYRGKRGEKLVLGVGGGGVLPHSGLLLESAFRCQSPGGIRKLCRLPLIFYPQHAPSLHLSFSLPSDQCCIRAITLTTYTTLLSISILHTILNTCMGCMFILYYILLYFILLFFSFPAAWLILTSWEKVLYW